MRGLAYSKVRGRNKPSGEISDVSETASPAVTHQEII